MKMRIGRKKEDLNRKNARDRFNESFTKICFYQRRDEEEVEEGFLLFSCPIAISSESSCMKFSRICAMLDACGWRNKYHESGFTLDVEIRISKSRNGEKRPRKEVEEMKEQAFYWYRAFDDFYRNHF